MGANFTPNFVGYTGMKPFRFWCQKVLPSVYDDSLSYYEVLCKLVAFLNQVIDNLEGVEQNTDALLNAYNLLQDYVNHYFDNLDLVGAVEEVIDGMVEDGTFDEILAPVIDEYRDELQEILDGYTSTAKDYVEDAEAWAKGTRNGVAVDNDDVAFNNNSKYYAEQSGDSATAAQNASSSAQGFADESEAWAKGTVGGVAVPATADQYQDNSKYWCEQARQAAVDATYSEEAEAWATGEVGGTPVASDADQYENNAKYYAEQAGQLVADATHAEEAQAWATGEVDGVPVASDADQYHNNAKYYAEQAGQAASDTTMRDEAEAWAVGTVGGVPVASGSDQYENNAKYYAEQAAQDVSTAVTALNASIQGVREEMYSNLFVLYGGPMYVRKAPQNGGTAVPGLVEFYINGYTGSNSSTFETIGDYRFYANDIRLIAVKPSFEPNKQLVIYPYDASLGKYNGNKIFAVRVWDLINNTWAADGVYFPSTTFYFANVTWRNALGTCYPVSIGGV